MTPYELNILTHIYSIAEPIKYPCNELFEDTISNFFTLKIIDTDASPSGYRVTELGKAWIVSILSTPLPRTAYVDGNGTVIDLDQGITSLVDKSKNQHQ